MYIDRPDAPNIAVVVTDGISNINSRRTITEAINARAKNIHIYSIGIGLKDTKEVFAIATPPPLYQKSYILVSDRI
jgi:collagen type VI alpha